MGSAPRFAQKTARMAFVHHHERVIFVGQIADFIHLSNRSVHRKRAVGGNHFPPNARVVGFLQTAFEVAHRVVFVPPTLRFAEPNAVNNGGVIEFIADNCIVFEQKRLKKASVCIERGGVQNGIFGSQKIGDAACIISAKRRYDVAVRDFTFTNPSRPFKMRGLFSPLPAA